MKPTAAHLNPEHELDESTSVSAVSPDHDTPEVEQPTLTDEIRGKKVRKPVSKKKKIFFGILGVVALLLASGIAVGVYTMQVVQNLRARAESTRPLATQMYAHFKEQNLPQVDQDLKQLQTSLNEMQAEYQRLSFYRFVPLASAYFKDGEHGFAAAQAGLSAGLKTVETVTPYADVLGFTGAGSFTGGTAEDRLKVVLQTLDKVAPQLDAVTADLQKMDSELAAIDPSRYPEQFKDQKVRPYLLQAQELSKGAVAAVTEFRPVIEQLPAIAGGRGERKKYLILFENDNELRPTGGFMTAYAIVNIENGKVEPEKSDDIYEIDKKFTKKLPIPPELGRYLTTETRWNLRDMNVSPDFKLSMDQFYENYKTIKGEPEKLDGIIAVDTEFLTDLLRVLGPVEVPGYGTFGAENDKRCDCPQIIYILSEIITRPTPYLREDRKGIIGPLMRSLLTKAYTAPKQSWPQLFEAGLQNMAGRHIQAYFLNEDAQKAAEAAGAAGRMTPPSDGSDFLAIVNANLGGAKSNLFVDYEVEQVVAAPQNGTIKKTVTITYKNNRKGDNCNLEAGLLCLNSTLHDWTRLYVPAGSTLESAQGFTEDAKTYEENGFTVIDGFFKLEPLGTAKLTFTYLVPYTNAEQYRVQMWKQGGIETYQLLTDAEGNQVQQTVDKDTTVELDF